MPVIYFMMLIAGFVSAPLALENLTLLVILALPVVSVLLFAYRLSIASNTDYQFSWRDQAMLGVCSFSVIVTGVYLWYLN